MCKKDETIEQLLTVFSEYLTSNRRIDIFFSSKFGYLMIDKWHISGSPDYQIQEIKNAEQLYKMILEKMEQDYMATVGIEGLELPNEHREKFCEWRQRYLLNYN